MASKTSRPKSSARKRAARGAPKKGKSATSDSSGTKASARKRTARGGAREAGSASRKSSGTKSAARKQARASASRGRRRTSDKRPPTEAPISTADHTWEASLDLGIIGNGTINALIDARGRIVWHCVPAFDGDPVFCSLLSPKLGDTGFFDIALENETKRQ
ncbi:MAG: hypothetical protein ACREPZ_05330, partial [Rhodanobacteraceae bacterium]